MPGSGAGNQGIVESRTLNANVWCWRASLGLRWGNELGCWLGYRSMFSPKSFDLKCYLWNPHLSTVSERVESSCNRLNAYPQSPDVGGKGEFYWLLVFQESFRGGCISCAWSWSLSCSPFVPLCSSTDEDVSRRYNRLLSPVRPCTRNRYPPNYWSIQKTSTYRGVLVWIAGRVLVVR